MADYVKQTPLPSPVASEEVRRTVSEMLLEIERRGTAAIRDYSRQLDNWDPPSFRADAATIAAAADSIDAALKGHIALAQAQVRGFAERQRGARRIRRRSSTSVADSLALAQRLARSCGGDIAAQASTAGGQFTMRLPAA